MRFTRLLPDLIRDTEHAVRAYRADSDQFVRREVLLASADLYGLLRSYCRRIGRPDLSLPAAERAQRAAEAADDPVSIAVARWNLAHVLLSQDGAAAQAEDVARAAVRELRDTPEGRQRTAMEVHWSWSGSRRRRRTAGGGRPATGWSRELARSPG